MYKNAKYTQKVSERAKKSKNQFTFLSFFIKKQTATIQTKRARG